MTASIHASRPILETGQPLDSARAAMIMIHGRGGGASSIMPLLTYVNHPDFAYLVPQAQDDTWYPQRFIVPRSANEPYLSAALQRIGETLAQLEAAGIPAEKTILLGFSQGACLALEYAARNPQRYGGVVALSGGLIGSDEELSGYVAGLAETPVFLGCSDVDSHIPLARVHKSGELLRVQGAIVTERIYPGMGHTINTDEIDHVTRMMAALV